MPVSWWRTLLQRFVRLQRRRPIRKRTPLGMERLEDRLVPSSFNDWIDADTNGMWNDANNWSAGHVPAAGEIAQFTGGGLHGNDAVTIAGPTPTVGGIDVEAGYTSTITDNTTLTLSNASAPGSFTLASGTFTVGPGVAISVAGDWNATGGTFTAGNGTVTFDGDAQSVTSGGNAFNNLTHNGTSTLTVQDGLTIAGTLTNTANTLDANSQTISAGTTTVSGGILLVTGSFTGNVTVSSPGTLTGTGTVTGNVSGSGAVSPGNGAAGIGVLTIDGKLTRPGSVDLQVNAPYDTAGTDFDQLIVSGTLDLSGSTLHLTGGTAAPTPLQMITLIHNTSGAATITSGTTSPAQAATVNLGGPTFHLYYNGGAGADVVLVDAATPTVAFVSGTFAGDNVGQAIADADFGTPGNQPAIFGVNAFTTIGAALAAVTTSGQVVVNAGTYPEAVSIGGTQTLTITGSAAVTVNSLSTSAGTTVQVNGTSLTLGNGSNTTIAGVVAGAGHLIKTGSGTVALTAADTYTGATSIAAGTLEIDGSVTSAVTVTSPATLAGTGTIAGGVSGTGTIAPGAGGGIGILTIDGSLTQPGTVALQVNAPYATAGTNYDQLAVSGTLDLSGTTLHITGGTAAPLPQQVVTLIRNTSGAATVTSAGTSPAQAATVTLGSAKFLVSYNGGAGADVILVDGSMPTAAFVSATFAGDSVGQAIADANLGTPGNQPAVFGVNAFATIGAALAAITNSGQVTVNAGTYAEAVTVSGTQTLTITGGAAVAIDSLTTSAGSTVQINGTSLTDGDGTSTVVQGAVSGSGQLIKIGTGTLTLAATNTYTGATSVHAGTLQIDGSVSSSVIVASTATLTGTGTVTGNVSGSGTVAPGDAGGIGILTIDGSLTQPGTVALAVNTPYNTAGTDYDQLAVSGTLDLSGTTLTITGGTAAPSPQQLVTLIRNTGAGATITSATTSPTQASTITLGSATFLVYYNGGAGHDAVLVDASTPTVAYVSSTFTGNTGQAIADADLGTPGSQPAVVGINAFTTIGAALAAITSSGQVVVNAGTYAEAVTVGGTQTLTFTRGAAVTVNSLTTAAGTTVQSNGTSLTVGDSTSTIVAGAVTGRGQFIKTGIGTVTLSAADTYTGPTDVNAGTLEVDGSITSSVTVAAGAMLTGTGTVTGSVTGSGTVAPGDGGGIGVLTIGGNLAQPGTVVLQINAPYNVAGTDFDQMVVNGNVNLSGSKLNITGGTVPAMPQQVVTLIQNNGPNPTITNGATSPAPGAILTLGTARFLVFYNADAGNDVSLVDATPPTVVFVSPTFAGDNPGQKIHDADLGTPGNQPAVFGVNAFATIGAAVAAVTMSGQVIVNTGTYPEAVNLGATQTLTVTGGAAVTVNSLTAVAGTTVQINGNSLTAGDATSTTMAGLITGTGQLIKTGTGTVTLAAADTNATTTVNGGTLALTTSLTSNVTVTNPGTLVGTGTITGTVSGNGTVAPGPAGGIGVLTIDGNLTQPGTVAFTMHAPYNVAGTDFDQLVVTGTLDLSGSNLSVTGVTTPPLAQQLITLIQNTSASPTITSGATTPAPGAIVTLGGSKFFVFYNGDTGTNVVLVDASAPTVAYASPTFAGNSPGTFIADADLGTTGNQRAIFDVNAFATIGGALAAVTSSGQVIVNAGTYPEAVNVAGTRTLTVTNGAAVTVNALTSAAGTTVQLNGTSLTVGDTTNTTAAGVIAGAGQLIKTGAGMLTLSATDTYTGATNVNAGTLQVTGALSSSAGSVVNLNAAATLDGGGTGKVQRAVIVTVTGTGAVISNVTVQAGTTVDGITLDTGAENVTISSTTVTGSQNGIVANGVSGLQLTSDTLTGNASNGLNANVVGSTNTITGSHFDANGRGMLVSAGTLSVTNSTFDNNTATGSGGGIDLAAGSADVAVTDSLIAFNQATGAGAGINLEAGFAGSLVLVDSTVGQNVGDGIDVAGGTLVLVFDTLANNTVGGVNNTAAAANVLAQDSLFADNTTFDYRGPITSMGNNVFQTTPAATTTLAAADLVNVPALLAPLANYGGATSTYALLPGSAALAAGVTVPGIPTTDQRGIARPAVPDIGAFQSQGFAVTVASPAPIYRTMIGSLFLQADGSTPQAFQAQVTSAHGEPVAGGRVVFSATTGALGDSATPNATYLITAVHANVITFAQAPGFTVGQSLIYDDGGNKPIAGLVEGGTYLVSQVTGATVTITTAGGGAVTLTTPASFANQTLAPALSATGLAPTLVRANLIASAAAGTPYQLTAFAGGLNAPAAWNLFNQQVTTLVYNVQGATAGSFQPLNAQSGGPQDGPKGSLQFQQGGAVSSTFTVTLMDQETPPVKVVITGQSVSLQALYDKTKVGTINHVSAAPGSNPVTLSTGAANKASTTTTAGVATLTNLLIYQSVYNFSPATPGYQLQATFTNATLHASVKSLSAAFSILPNQLAVTASNFAGFEEKAFDIILASSSRGEIRLLDIASGANGLPTNAIAIQAFDWSASGVAVASTTYNGPVTLSASGATGAIKLLLGGLPYLGTSLDMAHGFREVLNVTPQTALGTFNLFADTTTPAADPGGMVDVTSKSNAQGGVFIRIDLGRQRGR